MFNAKQATLNKNILTGNVVQMTLNGVVVYKNAKSSNEYGQIVGGFNKKDFYEVEMRNIPLFIGTTFIVGQNTKSTGMTLIFDTNVLFSVSIEKSRFNPTWSGQKTLVISRVK